MRHGLNDADLFAHECRSRGLARVATGQAMVDHCGQHRLDVFGDHVIAAILKRPGLGGTAQRQARARRQALFEYAATAAEGNQFEQIIENRIARMYRAGGRLPAAELFGVCAGRERFVTIAFASISFTFS